MVNFCWFVSNFRESNLFFEEKREEKFLENKRNKDQIFLFFLYLLFLVRSFDLQTLIALRILSISPGCTEDIAGKNK